MAELDPSGPVEGPKSFADRLREMLEPVRRSESEAKRLLGEGLAPGIFVGLCNMMPQESDTDLGEGQIRFRRVHNPPSGMALLSAANWTAGNVFGVEPLAASVISELHVTGFERDSVAVGIAWHALALLKLRSGARAFAAGHTTTSWNTIAAFRDHSLVVQTLDPIAVSRPTKETERISSSDSDWVRTHLEAALRLRDARASGRFGLAFNIAYGWDLIEDRRAALAYIWSGLEALFSRRDDERPTAELLERVVDWVPSEDLTALQQMYSFRSDAVHGRPISRRALDRAVSEAVGLLRRVLMECVDHNSVPLPDWGRLR